MTTDLPHIVRVTVEGTYNAEPWVNVYHFWFRAGTAPTTADLTALLGILDDASADNDSLLHFYNAMDSGVNINTLTATTLDLQTPLQVAATVNLNGTSVGNDLPPMLSVVVQWRTAIANRRSRGRTYLTGLNAGMILSTNADRVDTALTAALSTACNQFVAAWVANATWGLIVLSQTEREADIPAPYEEVLTAAINPLVCVQRRRREVPL